MFSKKEDTTCNKKQWRSLRSPGVIAVQQTLKETLRKCLQKEWNRFQTRDNVSNKVGNTGNRLKKGFFFLF